MTLFLFRHLWGVSEPWETVFPKIRQHGYRGIECVVPNSADRARFSALLSEHAFHYIAQIVTEGNTAAEHLESFQKRLEDARSLSPRCVVSHSGRDAFSLDEAMRFFEGALRIEREMGVDVAHETHRGRIMYNPWRTMELLRAFSDLKLCCDFSHWVCVCERLLEDAEEILRTCAGHCLHVHARVGYEEGPQVPDPRAPEFERQLLAHERWWRMIWEEQLARGLAESTLTPEFGPPDYLHTLPHTGVPVADLWEICNWQARRQSQRFSYFAGGPDEGRSR